MDHNEDGMHLCRRLASIQYQTRHVLVRAYVGGSGLCVFVSNIHQPAADPSVHPHILHHAYRHAPHAEGFPGRRRGYVARAEQRRPLWSM